MKFLCTACQEIEAPADDVYCPPCQQIAEGNPDGYRQRMKRAEHNIEAARRRRNDLLGLAKKAKARNLHKLLMAGVKDYEEYMAEQQGVIDWCKARLAPPKPDANLADQRRRQGLTRAQLAGQLDCSEQYVKMMELGQRPLSDRASQWLDRIQKSATGATA